MEKKFEAIKVIDYQIGLATDALKRARESNSIGAFSRVVDNLESVDASISEALAYAKSQPDTATKNREQLYWMQRERKLSPGDIGPISEGRPITAVNSRPDELKKSGYVELKSQFAAENLSKQGMPIYYSRKSGTFWMKGKTKRMTAKQAKRMGTGILDRGMQIGGRKIKKYRTKRVLAAPTAADFTGMIGSGLIVGTGAAVVGGVGNYMARSADKLFDKKKKRK